MPRSSVSLGAGRADEWSDVDLLVVVKDSDLEDRASSLPRAAGPVFVIDARHNGPVGTRASSVQYVVDSLPLWVDWHIHPMSRASWPSDCAVLFERREIGRTPDGFTAYLNQGKHEPAIPKSSADEQALRLALVPIAAKQIARRSPETARTIAFLGGVFGQELVGPQAVAIRGQRQVDHPGRVAVFAYPDLACGVKDVGMLVRQRPHVAALHRSHRPRT